MFPLLHSALSPKPLNSSYVLCNLIYKNSFKLIVISHQTKELNSMQIAGGSAAPSWGCAFPLCTPEWAEVLHMGQPPRLLLCCLSFPTRAPWETRYIGWTAGPLGVLPCLSTALAPSFRVAWTPCSSGSCRSTTTKRSFGLGCALKVPCCFWKC